MKNYKINWDAVAGVLKYRHWSQADLARAMNISPPVVCNMKKASYNTPQSITDMAAALRVRERRIRMVAEQ